MKPQDWSHEHFRIFILIIFYVLKVGYHNLNSKSLNSNIKFLPNARNLIFFKILQFSCVIHFLSHQTLKYVIPNKSDSMSPVQFIKVLCDLKKKSNIPNSIIKL